MSLSVNAPVLALDVGGTKLAGGLLVAGALHHRHEVATLAREGAEAILGRLIGLARQVMARAEIPPVAVGVASAGQIDPHSGDVIFATDNLPGWTGLPLGKRLSEALGLPVFVENDVNAFALAEAALGAGKGYRHLVLAAVGTGVGGGIVIDGQLYSGHLGRAGEIGHICVVPEGRPCTCGQIGCLESYAGMRVMLPNSGFESMRLLADHYLAGETIPAVDESALWLGRGLAIAAHLLGPEAILVGGSIGLLGYRYLDDVRRSFAIAAVKSYRNIPILPTQLGADSGILGAGVLALQRADSVGPGSPV
jgi:glucokinase